MEKEREEIGVELAGAGEFRKQRGRWPAGAGVLGKLAGLRQWAPAVILMS